MEEDLLPRPRTPRKLDEMSIAELEEVVAACEARIAQARAVIAAKQGARNQADSIFRKG